jgi:DsbC/DsbD-like thiol-disulfide interchange protein
MQYILAILAAGFLMLTRPSFVQPVPSSVPDVRMTCQAGQAAARPGDTFLVLCTLDIPDGFHVYWKSPGASGTPTEFQVEGTGGLLIGDTLYPRPSAFDDPAGRTYGYEGRTQFLVPVTVLEECPEGALAITVRAQWLACKKVCWRGEATRGIELKVSKDTVDDPISLFTQAVRCIPSALSDRPGTSMSLTASEVEIRGSLDGMGLPGFIPVEVPGVILDEARISGDTSDFLVRIPYRLEPGNSLGVKPRIEGLLLFGDERHDPSFAFSMPVPPAEQGAGREDPVNRRNTP